MNRTKFWSLIDKTRTASHGEPTKQRELLVDALSVELEAELISFANHYYSFIAEAYRWELWNAIWLINDGGSDDSFYDFRDFLVAKGQATYERVINRPLSLLSDKLDEDGCWRYQQMASALVANEVFQKTLSDADEYCELKTTCTWPEEPSGRWIDVHDPEVVEREYPEIADHLKQHNRWPP